MHTFQTVKRIAHSAEDMMALVADVEHYPQFVPLCESLRVLRRERSGAREVLVASMTIGYKRLSETFTSRVSVDRPARTIVVEYLDGPFRHLENRWRFEPRGPFACDVHFYIAYEFRSRSLQLLMGSLFDRAFRKFVEAFEARADAIYGRPEVRSESVAAG